MAAPLSWPFYDRQIVQEGEAYTAGPRPIVIDSTGRINLVYGSYKEPNVSPYPTTIRVAYSDSDGDVGTWNFVDAQEAIGWERGWNISACHIGDQIQILYCTQPVYYGPDPYRGYAIYWVYGHPALGWSVPVEVSDPDPAVMKRARSIRSIHLDATNTLYVLNRDTEYLLPGTGHFLKVLTMAGGSWYDEEILQTTSGYASISADITTTYSGGLHIPHAFWTYGNNIYYSYRLGAWTAPVVIITCDTPGSLQVCTDSDDRIHLTWHQFASGYWYIRHRSLKYENFPDGAEWTRIRTVYGDGRNPSIGCNNYFPKTGDAVTIIYQRYTMSRVYASHTLDAGINWTDPKTTIASWDDQPNLLQKSPDNLAHALGIEENDVYYWRIGCPFKKRSYGHIM